MKKMHISVTLDLVAGKLLQSVSQSNLEIYLDRDPNGPPVS